MKHICTFAVLLLAACTSTKKTTLVTTNSNQAYVTTKDADSIIYYKTSIEFEQKDYLAQMLGSWNVHTMQRQTKLPEEALNVSLQLNEDKTFVAKTTCGEMKGTYSVKGVSIKFNDA